MANQQRHRKSGGARKIGNRKEKCQRYRARERRYKNKKKRWMRHNIAKDATQAEIESKLLEFDEIQERRKK